MSQYSCFVASFGRFEGVGVYKTLSMCCLNGWLVSDAFKSLNLV